MISQLVHKSDKSLSQSDLVGRLDEIKDVDLRWRIISTRQQGMQVRDGRSYCLFVHNIIQIPVYTHTHACTLGGLQSIFQSGLQSRFLPAKDSHGLPLVTAGQQGIHVVMEHSQRHLQTDTQIVVWLQSAESGGADRYNSHADKTYRAFFS